MDVAKLMFGGFEEDTVVKKVQGKVKDNKGKVKDNKVKMGVQAAKEGTVFRKVCGNKQSYVQYQAEGSWKLLVSITMGMSKDHQQLIGKLLDYVKQHGADKAKALLYRAKLLES